MTVIIGFRCDGKQTQRSSKSILKENNHEVVDVTEGRM